MIDLQDVMDSIKYECPYFDDDSSSIIIVDMFASPAGIKITYKKDGLKKHHKKEFYDVGDFEDWLESGDEEDE